MEGRAVGLEKKKKKKKKALACMCSGPFANICHLWVARPIGQRAVPLNNAYIHIGT